MRFAVTKLIIKILFLSSLTNSFVWAQIKGSTAEEKQRNAEKKKEQLRKEELEAIEKGRKRHEKLQTKETRKRMKKSKKKADRINANKKPPLWERMTTKFRGRKL